MCARARVCATHFHSLGAFACLVDAVAIPLEALCSAYTCARGVWDLCSLSPAVCARVRVDLDLMRSNALCMKIVVVAEIDVVVVVIVCSGSIGGGGSSEKTTFA